MSLNHPPRRSILLTAATLGGISAVPLTKVYRSRSLGINRMIQQEQLFSSGVDVEMRGPVVLIGLNRSGTNDWVNAATVETLSRLYEHIELSSLVGAAVLYALGENFSSGLHVASGVVAQAIAAATWRGTKPLVAVVHGEVQGLANTLPLAADARITTADARFTHLDALALEGPAAMTLIEDVGRANARRYLRSGEHCGAHEALRLGLVQDLSATRDEALDMAIKLAGRMAARTVTICV